MKNRFTLRAMLPALMIGAGVFSSCEPDNPNDNKTDVGDFSRYVVATSTTASNNTSYALLTASSIESGKVSAKGNGLLNDGATQWIFARCKSETGNTMCAVSPPTASTTDTS